MPDRLLTEAFIIRAMSEGWYENLALIHQKHWTEGVLVAAINSGCFTHQVLKALAPSDLTPEVVRAFVETYENGLEWIGQDLMTSDVLLWAVQAHWGAIGHIPESLITDELKEWSKKRSEDCVTIAPTTKKIAKFFSRRNELTMTVGDSIIKTTFDEENRVVSKTIQRGNRPIEDYDPPTPEFLFNDPRPSNFDVEDMMERAIKNERERCQIYRDNNPDEEPPKIAHEEDPPLKAEVKPTQSWGRCRRYLSCFGGGAINP